MFRKDIASIPALDGDSVVNAAPRISNVSLSNDGSDNLDLSFESDEALGTNSTDLLVSVNGPNTEAVYSFNRSDFTESGTGPYTYDLSVTQAYDDGFGEYTASVDLAKNPDGSDGGFGQSDTYTLDTTAPTISSFTATNSQSQDVEVSFDSSEQLAEQSGDIDVTISGAESASLTEGDFTETGTGPYTYTATYAGSTDGDYTATLNSAKDADGNDGASSESDTVTVDTTAPTISNVALGNDGSDNLDLSFDSDEPLGSQTSDIQVTVDGPNTTDVYNFNRGDFTESGTGPYTYDLSKTQSYGDGDGTYTATVDTAEDPYGNAATNAGSDSYSFSSSSALDAFSFDVSTTEATSDFDWTVPDDGTGDTYDLELRDASDDSVSDSLKGVTLPATGTHTPSGSIGDEITYYVEKIRPSDGANRSSDNQETIIIEEAPDPVTDLTATGGDGQVTLDWTADDTVESDIQRYEVHRSQTQGFNPSAGDSTLVESVTSFTEGNATSYTDDGSGQLSAPSNGTTYYYEVIAVDADGFTADSNEASATPSATTGNGPSSASLDPQTQVATWDETGSFPSSESLDPQTQVASWQ